MFGHRHHWWLGAAATGLAIHAPAAAQTVEDGHRAWQANRFDEAVRHWRPLAENGDPEAQFRLGEAYRLGRGVPQDPVLAARWYERAANAGHVEAQGVHGLMLFQSGRRDEAMGFVRDAAEQGDMRARYVYGIALFYGALVPRDRPRAYAYMRLSAAQGMPDAAEQLAEMELQLSEPDRARGTELALMMARREPSQATADAAEASPAASAARPSGDAPATASNAVAAPAAQSPPLPDRIATPAPTAPASGRWRIQLGAYSSEANARRAWQAMGGRLGGLQPAFVPSGHVIRLQAGPFPSRAAAQRACASLAGIGCFAVGP